jgi:purine-nucleoside phosphorylase
MNTFEKISQAVEFLKPFNSAGAKVAVVLGSGLGNFVQEIKVEHEVPYSDIPHFPVSTVIGHSGKLIFGSIGGKSIIAMSGRFHFYEGYSAQDVILPVRVMKFLGVETLMLSNAAGGVDPGFVVGDLMMITDHISFFTENPLIGKNDERLGTRFPDMSEPYSKDLHKKAREVANKLDIELKEGVYVAVTGPTFETHAEYKLIQIIGAHAVGMSTVQEVIAAAHIGLKVFAMSVITDIGIREEDNKISHEEVLEAANAAEPKFSAIFRELIASLD